MLFVEGDRSRQRNNFRPRPRVHGYFFLPDSSTRGVFKSNSPVYTHPMAPGFTLDKLGLHIVPPYWVIRDWTRPFHVIRFENIRGFFHCPDIMEFVADLFIFHSRAGLKKIRIRYRIRRTRTEAVSGKKKLRIQKYPYRCWRGLKLFLCLLLSPLWINTGYGSLKPKKKLL